jgi:hypothetical protein
MGLANSMQKTVQIAASKSVVIWACFLALLSDAWLFVRLINPSVGVHGGPAYP